MRNGGFEAVRVPRTEVKAPLPIVVCVFEQQR